MTDKQKNRSGGFTLIEISIVMLLVAIAIPPLLEVYAIHTKSKQRQTTQTVIETASSYLQIYSTKYLNYPCPASRTAGAGTVDYGLDYCSISPANRTAVLALASPGCLPGGAICKVPGTGNRDSIAGNDPVLIGAVPFKTLGAGLLVSASAEDAMIDGWGNMLTYAISQNLTQLSDPKLYGVDAYGNDIGRKDLSQDFRLGVIRAVDEFGNPTSGVNDDAQFVIVSHGEDMIGTYTRFGVLARACSAVARDRENCNLDSTFMNALGDYEGTAAQHFDDIAYFYKNGSGELWKYITDTTTGNTTGSILNLNSGNVGVGTPSPITQLDLGNTGILRTPSFGANMICKPDTVASGKQCLPLTWLWNGIYTNTALPSVATPAGPVNMANRCANATDVMEGISLSQVKCVSAVDIQMPVTPGPVQCDAGAYLSGVLTNGCILCSSGVLQKCP